MNYVSDLNELFGETEGNGHFFPVEFNEKYKNKKLTISGRKSGDKQIQVDDDLLLVQRIENLDESAKKLTVKDDADTLFTVDFTDATLKEE